MSNPANLDPALIFDEMASRIRRNPGEFAGAYVVIGPDNIVIQNAFFSPAKNVATFWGMAKTHISLEADTAVQNSMAQNATAQTYGRR